MVGHHVTTVGFCTRRRLRWLAITSSRARHHIAFWSAVGTTTTVMPGPAWGRPYLPRSLREARMTPATQIIPSARIRVTPRMTVTIRLFSSNGHKSGTIGSGLASRAQNCPLFDWTRSGYRAITCFVSSEQRGPHVCLRTRSSRQGTPEEREVKSDSSEVSDTL